MKPPATMETAPRAANRREPLARGKRIVITILVAVLVSVILGFVALTGQLISMQRHMHEEFSALRDEMRTEFGGLSDRMTRIETLLRIHYGPPPGS